MTTEIKIEVRSHDGSPPNTSWSICEADCIQEYMEDTGFTLIDRKTESGLVTLYMVNKND